MYDPGYTLTYYRHLSVKMINNILPTRHIFFRFLMETSRFNEITLPTEETWFHPVDGESVAYIEESNSNGYSFFTRFKTFRTWPSWIFAREEKFRRRERRRSNLKGKKKKKKFLSPNRIVISLSSI